MPEVIHHKSSIPSNGFTLMEVLLAVFIFGIVMTTIFGSFNAIFGSVKGINEKVSQHEMIKTCLDRISEDLTSIYLTHYPLYSSSEDTEKADLHRIWGETRNVGNDTFSFLRFTSYAHLPIENNFRKGIAQIIYYVQPMGNKYVLKRSDRLYPYTAIEDYLFAQDAMDPWLCMNLQSFYIVYIDAKGEEFESWNSENEEFRFGTPKAIRINLAVGFDDQIIKASTMVFLPTYRNNKEP